MSKLIVTLFSIITLLVSCQEKQITKTEVVTLVETTESWNGEPLPAYPEGKPKVTVLKVIIPPQTRLGTHYHPVINSGVVVKGELTVVDKEDNSVKLKAGDALVEVVNTVHYGINDGSEPVEIIVFYAGVDGEPVTIPVSNQDILSPTLLNSERINLKFGSYGIEVLENNNLVRISNLFNTKGEEKITRTFAVVTYPVNTASQYIREHELILGGGSIGKVFKENGWEITKKPIYFGRIEKSLDYEKVYGLMQITEPSVLDIYLYEFYIKKEGQQFKYATIAEVYHPEYLDFNDLKVIYKGTINQYLEATPDIKEAVEIVKEKMRD